MSKLVYVTRKIPVEGMGILTGSTKLKVKSWNTENVIPRQQLLQEVEGMHGILCTISDNIDKELLDAAGRNYYFHFLAPSFTAFFFFIALI